MSSCTFPGRPQLTTYSNHTQSTAYIIGEIAAEKLIEEYGLEASRPEQVVSRL